MQTWTITGLTCKLVQLVVAVAEQLLMHPVIGAVAPVEPVCRGNLRHLGHLLVIEDAPDEQRVVGHLKSVGQSRVCQTCRGLRQAWLGTISRNIRCSRTALNDDHASPEDMTSPVHTLRKCVKMLFTLWLPSLAISSASPPGPPMTAGGSPFLLLRPRALPVTAESLADLVASATWTKKGNRHRLSEPWTGFGMGVRTGCVDGCGQGLDET